jgi:hypothetical protein
VSAEYRRSRVFNERDMTFTDTVTRVTTGQVLVSNSSSLRVSDSQETWSQETLWPQWQRMKRRARARGRTSGIVSSKLDVGSGFQTIRRSYSDNRKEIGGIPDRVYIGSRYVWNGPILGSNPNQSFSGGGSYYPGLNLAAISAEMITKGATAISRTIPTNPVVGVGVAVGESMERLPRLPGSALLGRAGNVSKKFADEYLNLEFGVKPMISDIRDTYETVKETNRLLDQLRRDSGRLVRRRYEFPTERTYTLQSSGTGYSYPARNTVAYDGQGPWTVHRETVKRVWFSGAYTYYYDQSPGLWGDLKRREQEGNRLFGARLTPSLIWELSPWSWAADWKTNAGDVISNISAFSRDGLVMRWGYIMMDYTVTDIHTRDVRLHTGGVARSVQRFETRLKKRLKATPYGFGLDPDWKDFSSRQLAILGALGISRSG